MAATLDFLQQQLLAVRGIHEVDEGAVRRTHGRVTLICVPVGTLTIAPVVGINRVDAALGEVAKTTRTYGRGHSNRCALGFQILALTGLVVSVEEVHVVLV